MYAASEKKTHDPQQAWRNAFSCVLRPLVRVMLARGLNYLVIAEMLKSLFVEIADKEFKLANKRQTDSRVSLLTGVHRKDVKRLRRDTPDVSKQLAPSVSFEAQVIAAWNANPAAIDEDGVPMPLARFAQDGGEQSFEKLVKSISTDIHPRALLDEWLRRGIVEINDKNQVRLLTEAFIPDEGQDEKIFYFGHDLHDHAATSAHNMLGGTPPFLERCIHYDGLDAAAIAAIRDLATKHGMRALRAVNVRAAEALRAGRDNPPAHPGRLTFGVYFYQEPQVTNDTATGEDAKS